VTDAAASSTPATGLTASGLTAAQVAERVAAGQVNRVDEQTSRPLSAIIRANVLTRFNAILGVLFVAVLVVGSPADALFGLVIPLLRDRILTRRAPDDYTELDWLYQYQPEAS